MQLCIHQAAVPAAAARPLEVKGADRSTALHCFQHSDKRGSKAEGSCCSCSANLRPDRACCAALQRGCCVCRCHKQDLPDPARREHVLLQGVQLRGWWRHRGHHLRQVRPPAQQYAGRRKINTYIGTLVYYRPAHPAHHLWQVRSEAHHQPLASRHTQHAAASRSRSGTLAIIAQLATSDGTRM